MICWSESILLDTDKSISVLLKVLLFKNHLNLLLLTGSESVSAYFSGNARNIAFFNSFNSSFFQFAIMY